VLLDLGRGRAAERVGIVGRADLDVGLGPDRVREARERRSRFADTTVSAEDARNITLSAKPSEVDSSAAMSTACADARSKIRDNAIDATRSRSRGCASFSRSTPKPTTAAGTMVPVKPAARFL
jgi:hypothetical protein